MTDEQRDRIMFLHFHMFKAFEKKDMYEVDRIIRECKQIVPTLSYEIRNDNVYWGEEQ